MDGVELEYWDSCIFLALLQKEKHKQGELECLEQQSRKFDIGALSIITSSITIAEVFEARLSDDSKLKIRDMYARSNFRFVDATVSICQRASEIRGYYKVKPIKDNGIELYPSLPDAIHIASAIAAQAVTGRNIPLITFDSKNKPQKKELGLTGLSGMVANKYKLTICRPLLTNKLGGLLDDET